VVAVSEGISDAKGTAIATTLAADVQKDAHGNVELGGGALADYLGKAIKDTLGLKRVRGDTFGYLQRSFAGCVSDVDQREAREAGRAGLTFALDQDRDGSVTIHRLPSAPYAASYQFTALEELAAKTRHMPDEFIAATGTDVTPAFVAYLAPLLGSGMPRIRRLDRHPVAAPTTA
jgi:6-phosphofructokinase 1